MRPKPIVSLLLLFAIAVGTFSAGAVSASSFKIYLNAGHGSWGPNDRPAATIPYPNLSSTGRPDTCGFYESNTNLQKVFGVYDEMRAVGVPAANIKLSRWKNGPYPYVSGASDAEIYNKPLTTICAEVEQFAPDYYLSIHSNAATDGTTTNYPLFLYRGTDGSGGDAVNGSRDAALAIWPKHWMNDIDPTSNYSSTSTNVRGDVSFYGSGTNSTNSYSGTTYYGYLGALKHGYKGMLAEGFFHTYQPARHRALNFDYCRQEGVRFSRGIRTYFSLPAMTTGYIMGTVKDASNPLTNSLYNYKSGSVDATAPINGAVVKLYNSGGTLLQTYTTDNNYNGVFVFKNLSPGTYKISVIANGYSDLTNQTVTVTADATAYPKYLMTTGQSSGTGGSSGGSQTVAGTKRIFAYDLRVTQSGGNYTFTYKSNTAATAGTLNFLNASTGAVVGTVSLGAPVEGQNSITIPATDLPGTAGQTMKWSVTLEGGYIQDMAKINSGTTFDYTIVSGLVVDNSPESDYFGRFYVANTVGKANASNGLWAYKQDNTWTRINSTVYRGGQTHTSPTKMGIDYQGRVYMSDYSDATSGISVVDPSNLSGSFTQFFQGSRASNGLWTNNGANVGSSVASVAIGGSGSSSKLYAYLEDFEKNNIGVYNIGNSNGSISTTWGSAPSSIVSVSSKMVNGFSQVCGDSKGGVWCSQRRATDQTTANPCLLYVNSSGTQTFNSGSCSALNNNGFTQNPGAGFAISPDNSMLAIGNQSGLIGVFDITWNGTTPSLTLKCTISGSDIVRSANISGAYGYPTTFYQMAFDWGGNLYVGGQKVGIYSIPTQNNASTVPAKSSLTVTKAAPSGPVADRGIYAYDLNSEDNHDGSYTFSFKPNTNASNAKIVFYDSTSGQELGTYDIGTATKDVEKTVNISLSQIPGQGIINWGVRLTGTAISSAASLMSETGYIRTGVVVDNSPESEYFGRFYVFNSVDYSHTGSGLYAYNQNYSRINSSVYRGGQTFGNVWRLGIDWKGTVYINDSRADHSGIYLAYPNNLSGSFNQLFAGTRDANGLFTYGGASIGGKVMDATVIGTGANAKMYSFDRSLSNTSETNVKNILVYNIGNSDGTVKSSITSAANQMITVNVLWQEHASVNPDDKGGFWFSQFRSEGGNNSSAPAFGYVNSSGSVVFNAGSLSSDLTGNVEAAFAVSPDNKRVACADGSKHVKVYNVTWSGTTPSLSLAATIDASALASPSNSTASLSGKDDGYYFQITNGIYQLAFDWGGNLYVGGHYFGIYALPTNNNTSTVPARKSLFIDKISYTGLTLAEMVDANEGVAAGDGVELEDANLLVVCVSDDGRTLYAKDANNYNYGNYPTCGASQIDLLKLSLTGVDADQSNWVAINLPRALTTSDPNYSGHYVSGVKGVVVSVVNPEITMLTMPTVGSAQSYTENKYAPCNFLPANWSNNKYFIVQPKPMEYAEVTWAVWNSSANAFILPQTTTAGQTVTLNGGFRVNTSKLSGHENAAPSSIYSNGQAYKMKAIIKRNESASSAPRKIDGQSSPTVSDYYTVYPLSYSADDIVTGIELPLIDEVKTPRAVRYYLPNGMELRDKPESGIYIEVTEYTDGSTSSRKVAR